MATRKPREASEVEDAPPAWKKIIHPVGLFFFDSGAHGLYTTHSRYNQSHDRYKYFKTKKFKKYVDRYANFIKKHQSGIDFYANVDVIHNPELSWKVLKYLEDEHGLSPIPVIHPHTDIKWLDKHLDAGYKYIGLGGVGQENTRATYTTWADYMFSKICPMHNNFLPTVKVHGFAMTSHALITRYPWYSVDSTSWVQSAAWGSIFIPAFRNGDFTFQIEPHVVMVSSKSKSNLESGDHYYTLSKREQQLVSMWLERIDVPFGSTTKWGVHSEHNARKIANLRFFEHFAKSFPEWPWPFRVRRIKQRRLLT